jgi:hypothetical protein
MLFPSRIAGRDGRSWVVTRFVTEEAWYRTAHAQRDGGADPPVYGRWHVWTARQVKIGKVWWVAEALPHSEGATYKRQCREIVACS